MSLACGKASPPVAWRLYMPQEWIADDERRKKAGVPQEVGFATKPMIAPRQIKRLMDEGAPCTRARVAGGSRISSIFDTVKLSINTNNHPTIIVWIIYSVKYRGLLSFFLINSCSIVFFNACSRGMGATKPVEPMLVL